MRLDDPNNEWRLAPMWQADLDRWGTGIRVMARCRLFSNDCPKAPHDKNKACELGCIQNYAIGAMVCEERLEDLRADGGQETIDRYVRELGELLLWRLIDTGSYRHEPLGEVQLVQVEHLSGGVIQIA